MWNSNLDSFELGRERIEALRAESAREALLARVRRAAAKDRPSRLRLGLHIIIELGARRLELGRPLSAGRAPALAKA